MDRFERQRALFGDEGQAQIARLTVAVVGVGGIGSHIVQQLAYLGVRHFVLIDGEELASSNLNRYVTSRHDDPIPGTAKVAIAERLIMLVDPSSSLSPLISHFQTREAFDVIAASDVVFGCLDHDGPRYVLNQVCSILDKRYIDCATEVNVKDGIYGGKVVVNWQGAGCLSCYGLLDMEEVSGHLAGAETRKNRAALYGVGEGAGGSGPSVVSLNGVVASIAMTEFMVGVTGLRHPVAVTKYYANQGRFTTIGDKPKENCMSCAKRGKGLTKELDQFLT